MSRIDTFEKLLQCDEVRNVIAQPRTIPRRNREDIAEILFKELVLDENFEIRDKEKFIEKFGAFYLLFISLKDSAEWERLKELAQSSRVSLLFVLCTVLVGIFDLLEDFSQRTPKIEMNMSDDIAMTLEWFSRIVGDTVRLWHRNVTSTEKPISIVHPKQYKHMLSEEIEAFQAVAYSRQFLNFLTESILLSDISGAMDEVEDELASLEILALLYPGRGWDRSMVELHRTNYENLGKYAKLIERNEDIKKILSIIGHTGLEYDEKNSSISSHSHAELYSVTQSKDLQYILPIDIVKLQDETLKYLFFSKLTEGKLLTYQLTGKHQADGIKKNQGPIVALVDTSGSMIGAPEVVAKSILLAIVRHMLKEKRNIKVFLFSSVDQSTEIELTDSRKTAMEFLNFLQQTFEGGTDFNTALSKGLKALKDRKYRNADILFITDGLSVVSDEWLIDELNRVKADSDTRIFTIIIGNDNAGGMEEFSDQIFILSKAERLDPDQSPPNSIKLITVR